MANRRPRSPEHQAEDLNRLWSNGFDHIQKGPHQYRIEGVADFWPSSGRWLFLDNTRDGYGVSDLIGALKAWRKQEDERQGPAQTPRPDVGAWRFEGGYWR